MSCAREPLADLDEPWEARLHKASASALYIHLPFCRRKCAYCDFASWATQVGDDLISDYLGVMERLLGEVHGAGLLEGLETAYVGGGTPTFVGMRLVRLVECIHGAAPGLVELTCEANPDSLGDDLMDGLARAGCTRLSVGVQSLQEDELRELGRIHSALQARDRLAEAVRRGFDVSCDLMCAIPLQNDASWNATLAAALSCGVGHVSIYPLQIEEGTPLDERVGDEEPPWNDSEVQARRMVAACKALEGAGFRRYEVASYARPGAACRHNQAYWTAKPYLGLGASASSMLTREGYEALRLVAPHLPALDEGINRVRMTCGDNPREFARARSLADLHFDLELLTEQQAAAEDLMLSMRMADGVSPGLLGHAQKVLGVAAVREALSWCAGRDLIEQDGLRWRPTEQGWLLGNELYGRLWDLSVGEVATCSC